MNLFIIYNLLFITIRINLFEDRDTTAYFIDGAINPVVALGVATTFESCDTIIPANFFIAIHRSRPVINLAASPTSPAAVDIVTSPHPLPA